MNEEKFQTLAVHAGEDREAYHGALSVPIFPASVYALPDADEAAAIHNEIKPGYYYGRLGNPTQTALEAALCRLEDGEAALAFSSGMAAISGIILTLVKAGEHIVAPRSMYSTTTMLLDHIAERFGIETTFIDTLDAEGYTRAIRPNTRLFWIETPTNPRLFVTDIAAVASAARSSDITTVVDNTFATPFCQRPLSLGADVVVHSATKYLGGHSDLTAGILVGSRDVIEGARHGAAKLFGGNIAPQVAWLVLRGIKTLAVRMERHCSNALAVARALSAHPNSVAVHYPGLPGHAEHTLATRQMPGGFGGMIALDVGTLERGRSFVNNVRLCTLATSLGGVETIVQHSASMTHSVIPPDERIRSGISDGLIRISVGIEAAEDLVDDMISALDNIES